MLISFKLGQGSIVLRVKIRNSSVSTGAGLTGLTSASSGLIISTIADNEASATAYTVAGSTIESITTLGTYAAPTATKCRFKEVDSTNHKGIYEIQIADARFAVSSAKSVLISISGATNAAECDALVPLTSADPYDAVRGGMTALPNANAEAAGGLYTRGTGAGQIKQTNNGEIDSNVTHINNIVTTSVTTVKAVIGLTTADTISALGANTITAASVASGALTSAKFASGALDAVWDTVLATHTTPGSSGDIIQTILDVPISTIEALIGTPGNLGGSGADLASNAFDIYGKTAPAATALTSAIWTNARAANLDNLNGVTFPTNFGTMSIDTNGRVKIQSGVTKNVAISGFEFFMCDSSDHVTGKTGLTITATRSLDGAAFASCANIATEISNGVYKIDLAAGDLNGNTVTLKFTGTGADDRIIEVVTTP